MKRRFVWAVCLGIMGMAVFGSLAHATIQLPFRSGQVWYVCNGYNGYGVHKTAPVLDLSTDPNSSVTGGCASSSKNAATGETVLAPIAGKVSWFRPDMLCITPNDETRSIAIGHLDPADNKRVKDGTTVVVGGYLGVVDPPNLRPPEESGNGNYAHIHIQAHPVADCPRGNLIPFTGNMAFEGVIPDLPYDGSSNQHSGKLLIRRNENGIPYPVGMLIRATGESDVFLVSVDNGNPARIVKRHVTSPAVFNLNHFDWRRIVEIALADKAFYLRGEDITGKVTVDGLTESELVRVKGDTIKVYVVSGGQLHWLNMSAAEFSLLGYSFSQIREWEGAYSKGKAITYGAFVSCFAPVLASPGTTLTEVKGTTDPRRYDKDPLVLFHAKSVVVGSPEDIRAFDKDTKAFLWQSIEARGNMEIDERKI